MREYSWDQNGVPSGELCDRISRGWTTQTERDEVVNKEKRCKRDLCWSSVNMQGSVHNHISKPLAGIQSENFCVIQLRSIIFEKSQQSGKAPSNPRKREYHTHV